MHGLTKLNGDKRFGLTDVVAFRTMGQWKASGTDRHGKKIETEPCVDKDAALRRLRYLAGVAT